MTRLPQPGKDAGQWGDILNDFLTQSHNTDGTLKDNVVGANQLQDNSVGSAQLQDNAVGASQLQPGSVDETTLSSTVQTKLNQTAPVTKVNNQTGDITLTKTDIGLNNVDNTSDSAKPVSTVQQAALDLKADTSALAAKLNTADLDAQTAAKITTDGTATQAALSSTYAAYDVTSPGTTDDTARIIAAATSASAAGRTVLRLAPGTYAAAGLTVSDISGLYVVGDGVTLTGAYVYPFTTDEWRGLSARSTATGGRGVVAFQVDDSLPEHWTGLFPLCKELQITMCSAFITGSPAPWITEAHRHGWEIASHMPDATNSTTLSLAELESRAIASLDTIEAAIGTREGVGFVYPQHDRNDETDRILSKFFTYGRSVASSHVYPKGGGRVWLTAARNIDSDIAGALSEALKNTLREVAETDGQIVLYLHFNNANSAAASVGLRLLVPFIRSLGMEIRNSNQVWGRTQLVEHPYDDDASWTLTGVATRTTDDAYHGTTSIRCGVGNSAVAAATSKVTPHHGMFTVMRMNYRVKTSGYTTSGNYQGGQFQVSETQRTLSLTDAALAQVQFGPTLPPTGATQSALDWSAQRSLLYLHPSTIAVTPRVGVANVTVGEMLIDEIKLDFLGYTPSVTYSATLNGTSNVYVFTEIPNLSQCTVVLQPQAQVAGFLSFTIGGSTLTVKSSSASDTAIGVKAIITPGPLFKSMALPATGA